MSKILNSKEYIRKLINIAYLSIGIPLLFFIYVYLESTSESLVPMIEQEYQLMFFIPIFIINLALIIWGQKKINLKIAEAKSMNHLSKKLAQYQKGTTQRFVSYSISSMLISIGFFLTDFQVFAALFGIMIVLFSINNPNARKTVIDLQLKDDEKNIVLNGLDLPINN